MKREAIFCTMAAVLVGGFVLVGRAAADDETEQVAVKVRAPIDATACDATPPTITVLGLSIDVGTASFGESSDGSGGGGSGDDDAGSGGAARSCATLAAGQSVEVKLGGDSAPLAATEIGAEGEDGVRVQGPVQGVDTAAQTITVLGLTIDVSQANLDGANDDDSESQPTDLTQLTSGQDVEVQLDASQLPALVATGVEIKNMTNEVEVEVADETGQDVEDSGDDMDVTVTETVVVHTTVAGTTRRARRQVQFHRSAGGTFVISGLPTGSATIAITRTSNGVTTTGHRRTRVRANRTRSVRLRLH
jgi:hypothetical protein